MTEKMSAKSMDAVDTELFINTIEENRNIWDVSDENYKNRDARQKSWENIASVFSCDFDNLQENEKKNIVVKLQKRWKTIRDAYIRCRAKRKTLKSGSGAKKSTKYVYYENLKFLENTMDLNNTETNISEDFASQSECHNVDPEDEEKSETEDIEDESQIERVKANTFQKNKQKKKLNVEESLVRFLNNTEQTKFDEDKSFLESLLPTLKHFDQDQKLEFRIEVLNLLVKIKNRGSETLKELPRNTPHNYPRNYFQQNRPSSSSASSASYDVVSPPPLNEHQMFHKPPPTTYDEHDFYEFP